MATSRRRILIVEDSATMRQLLAFALRRLANVEVVEARDGVDGLRKLMAEHFDVVLVDINMPVLDGLRLIQLIREEPGHSGLRIVVITTEGASADREKAMALGADAYLTKPVQAGDVLSIVKGLLSV
jgi:two-component system, chemotaxis family, chemotaxis protein CheY